MHSMLVRSIMSLYGLFILIKKGGSYHLPRQHCNKLKLGNFALYTYGIECFHSRDYWPYWFTETKESISIKIEFNSQRFSLGHQHGRHFRKNVGFYIHVHNDGFNHAEVKFYPFKVVR